MVAFNIKDLPHSDSSKSYSRRNTIAVENLLITTVEDKEKRESYFCLANLPYSYSNIVPVKQKFGHKSINNTMIYTHLIECEVEEYTSKVARNIKEAEELVNAGFEYVCDYNEEGKLFRKRK